MRPISSVDALGPIRYSGSMSIRLRSSARALALWIGASGLASMPTNASAAPPAIGPAVAPPSRALAPAPEPAELLGLLRWKNPLSTASSAVSTAGLPEALVLGGARQAAEGLAQELVGSKDMGAEIRLDAPVDAVVALGPKASNGEPIFAVSLALRSLEQAKRAAQAQSPLVEVEAGVFRIAPVSKDTACVIAAALGPDPARLVCGRNESDVLALAPYLARTRSSMPSGNADLAGEVRLLPLEARYGEQARQILRQLPVLARTQATLDDDVFDTALLEAATGLSDELVALTTDLDKLTFDVSPGAPDGITADGAVVFRGKSSWLVNTLIEGGSSPDPTPPLFWHAPVDADSASFSRTPSPERYAPTLRVLRGLTAGALAHAKIGSEAERRALTDLLDFKVDKGTVIVSAQGHLEAKPKPQKAVSGGASKSSVEDTVRSVLGWNLVGFSGGSSELLKQLNDFARAYNRPAIQAALETALAGEDLKAPTLRPVPAPTTLGPNALDLEFHLARAPGRSKPTAAKPDTDGKPEAFSITIHLLAMGDGPAVWVGLGTDRDALVRRLVAAKSGAPESGTIASRSGLDALRAGSSASAGFFTLAPLVEMLPSLAAGSGARNAPDAVSDGLAKFAAAAATLPNHGKTPIITRTRIDATPVPRAEFSMHVASGTLEDLGVLIGAGVAIGLEQSMKAAPPVDTPNGD